jgi:hypothetical protein
MKRIGTIVLILAVLAGLIGAAGAAETQGSAKLVVAAKLTVGLGSLTKLSMQMSDGSSLPGDLVLSTKSAKIAAFEDTAGGWFRAKKLGTTYLYVRSASTGLSARCKLTVKSNIFSRSKPLYQKGQAGIYTSAKKLYFKGNYLYAEIFFYNYTKYTLHFSDSLLVYGNLYYTETGEDLISVNDIWAPKGFKIRPKKYVVYKCRFPQYAYGSVDLRNLDLRAHELDAYMDMPDANSDEDDPDFYFTKHLRRTALEKKDLTEATDATEQVG